MSLPARFVAAVVLAGLLAACGSTGGSATPDAAAAEYVAALKAADSGRLERLADPDNDAKDEIVQRLRRLGGGRLVVERATVGDTESDHEKSVTFTGTLDGSPFSEQLWLHRHDDRWYLALGPNKNAHPKGTGMN